MPRVCELILMHVYMQAGRAWGAPRSATASFRSRGRCATRSVRGFDEKVLELRAREGVDGRERFVEPQQSGPREEAARDCDALRLRTPHVLNAMLRYRSFDPRREYGPRGGRVQARSDRATPSGATSITHRDAVRWWPRCEILEETAAGSAVHRAGAMAGWYRQRHVSARGAARRSCPENRARWD